MARESPGKYHLIKGDWMCGLLIFLMTIHKGGSGGGV